jgi:hypothetical protein
VVVLGSIAAWNQNTFHKSICSFFDIDVAGCNSVVTDVSEQQTASIFRALFLKMGTLLDNILTGEHERWRLLWGIGVDKMIILKRILGKWVMWIRLY